MTDLTHTETMLPTRKAKSPPVGRRVKIGVMIAVPSLIAIYWGGWIFSGFVALFVWLAHTELIEIMRARSLHPSRLIIISTAVIMIIGASLNHMSFLAPILTISVMASFFRLLFRFPIASMADIGATLLAVVYLVYFPAHYILLRDLQIPASPLMSSDPGLAYLLLVIFVIGISDIAAYYTGLRFGKNPLYVEISPKKTREGSLGGVLGGFFSGVAVCALTGFPMVHGMVLSLLLSVVGQIGDLVESLFKRDAGVKDSGGLLMEHGGILDRMDSYIFSGAVAYYYIYWLVLGQGLARDVLTLVHRWFP